MTPTDFISSWQCEDKYIIIICPKFWANNNANQKQTSCIKQWKKDFALNLVWCPCCHSFIAKVFHFLYSWRRILQVMHPFFELNSLLLPFRANAIGLFFRLLFIATGVTFAFWCRHWRSLLFCLLACLLTKYFHLFCLLACLLTKSFHVSSTVWKNASIAPLRSTTSILEFCICFGTKGSTLLLLKWGSRDGKVCCCWPPNVLKLMNKSTSPDMPFLWPHQVTYYFWAYGCLNLLEGVG